MSKTEKVLAPRTTLSEPSDIQLLRGYYFDSADDKFIKEPPPEFFEHVDVEEKSYALNSYEFKKPNIFPTRPEIDKEQLQIAFRTSPDSLLSMAAAVVEKLRLPKVYKWTIEDICKWLRQNGYPQYQHTFRVNLVNGRTFLLLDASALCAMNIKDFDHIRNITHGIRMLFYFEMTKFGHSITLPPEYLMELYKLLRVKSGTKYDAIKCTDLWRNMRLMRDRKFQDFREHWEILERWLKVKRDPSYYERIGGIPRYQLYKCKAAKEVEEPASKSEDFAPCKCLPPCECYWGEKQLREPWSLAILPSNLQHYKFKQTSVLSVLNLSFPERYKPPTVRSLRRFLSRFDESK